MIRIVEDQEYDEDDSNVEPIIKDVSNNQLSIIIGASLVIGAIGFYAYRKFKN